jgi:hypothetical protein
MTARMPIDERTATTDSMDAISLYSLAWACHDYAVLWNHDSAYWYFRKHREGAFSLCEEEHRKGLTELLNRWRCRLPVTGLLSERLHAWGNKNAPVLGSFRTNLLHLDKSGFSHAGKLYDTLKDTVRDAGVKRFGATATAKTLFAINPAVFPPWDDAIRADRSVTDDGAGYVDYMQCVKCQLARLVEDAAGFNIRPRLIAYRISHPHPQYVTLVRLVDEWIWMTVPRRSKDKSTRRWCAPPPKRLRVWLRWVR